MSSWFLPSLLLLLSLSFTATEATTTLTSFTTTLYFSGGPDNCTTCSSPCEPEIGYACSDGTGDWNGGAKTFTDLSPADSTVTQISLNVYATGNCRGGENPAILYFTLAAGVIGSFQIENNNNTGNRSCICGNCVEQYQISSNSISSGWPEYNYSGENTLNIIVTQNSVCFHSIDVTVSFVYLISFPSIRSITPDLGPLSGGTYVTVTGSHFYEGLMCAFNNNSVESYFIGDTQIECYSPPAAVAGEVQIYLRVPDRKEADIRGNIPTIFLYYVQPNISSIDPQKGPIGGGTLVTITGGPFFDSTFLSCHFGSLIARGIYIDPSHIVCKSPEVPEAQNVELTVSENQQQWSPSVIWQYHKPTSNQKKELTFLEQHAKLIIGIGVSFFLVVVLIMIAVVRKMKKRNGYESIPDVVPSEGEGAFRDLKLGDRIGRGSAGDVYKAVWLGTEVAVKVVPASLVRGGMDEDQLVHEAGLMKSLRHPNVLQFLGLWRSPSSLGIVMEYMPLGSLYRLLHNPSVDFSPKRCKAVAVDAAKGISYLHSFRPPIIHRDLKSHNLLVDHSWRVKVADFGLSTISKSGTMTACGTPCWTAPEVLRNRPYDQKADIYSLAIVLWETLTRRDPFEGMPPFQVVFAVGNQGLRPTLPSDIPPDLAALIVAAWKEDPNERPSIEELLSRLEEIDFGETLMSTSIQ